MSAPGLTPQLKAFNEELAGICSESPPISRSKMKAITTSGMKAIKMYKHVVQNVEKFISKSKPTYKVTGLYVIDALIRKSQAEFGPDKDVYAKRFQKNMLITFQHLAKSAISNEDKEKCKKIITLWRRGKTYEESLLDELDSIMLKCSNSVKSESIASKNEPNPPADDAEVLISTILSNPESEMAQNLAKMLGGPQQEQLQQILSKMKNNQPETQTEPIQDKSPLIDEVDRNSWQQPPPPLPPSHGKSIPISTIPPPNDWHQHPPPPHPLLPPPGAWEHPPPPRLPSPRHDRDHSRDRRRSRSPRRDFSPRRDRSRSRDRDSRRRRRSRTRSRSRDRDRKRSRSRDRDHRRDRYRRRSRSRERRSSRRDEISNREKMCLPSTKEGKGCVASRTIWIGNISKGDCTEESVRNMIKNVDRADDIEDITALHSRGCAYVVMKTRAAAFKTLQKLASKRGREEKRKVDWAINSGLKDAEMQAYFDKAEGAAFIEYSKLPEDIEVLIKWARGGVIDIESMPEKVQAAIAAKDRENSQSVDMEMDMDEKDPTSQVVGNATNLPMVGGMPTMTIPMGMPMPGQIPSGQIPLATPMGQHPLQGTPMMMGHQGLILPQGGVLPQGAAPRAPMMGFIPRERFPGPGGFGPRPPGGPGGMPDNHWNGPPGHSMGGPRHRGERFQSPRGRFPDDRGFDGGRGGPRGGHGSWNRGPPRQNFNDRDHRRDHQGDHRRDNRGDWPDRWGNAGGHQRGDRHRNDRSPNRDRGFSRLSPNPSHEHNPWGGRNTNGQGWQPHEIKQEKNNEQHTNNEENAQTNGWQSNEPKDAEEKTQPVPSDESKTNESNPPLHMIKSERTDPIQTDPPNESENTANTPIHDEPNTNDATSSAAAIQPVSGAADPGLEKSIYDPDSLLNSTVSSGVGEGTGEPSTAESTDDNRAQSTAISSPGND